MPEEQYLRETAEAAGRLKARLEKSSAKAKEQETSAQENAKEAQESETAENDP